VAVYCSHNPPGSYTPSIIGLICFFPVSFSYILIRWNGRRKLTTIQAARCVSLSGHEPTRFAFFNVLHWSLGGGGPDVAGPSYKIHQEWQC